MTKLKLQPRPRHLAATVTIALATGFIALVVLTVSLLDTAIRAQIDDDLTGIDTVVAPAEGAEGQAPQTIKPDDLSKVSGVDQTFYAPEFTFTMLVDKDASVPEGAPASEGTFTSLTVPRPGMDARLIEGSVPNGKNQIVIDESVAEKNDLSIGDTVKAQGLDMSLTTLTITGINQPPLWQPFSGYSQVIVDTESLTALAGGPGPDGNKQLDSRVGVTAADGVSEQQLADQLSDAGYDARTATEVRDEGHEMALASLVGISTMLGAFVIIALATSTLVVANSFAVTMAQRRRSFALARALGATRGQAMGAVVRDSVLVGAIGSILGVVGAYGVFWALLTWGRASYSKALPAIPDFNAIAVALPIIAGLVLAITASVAPALSVLKVKPLEALRPVEASQGRGISRLRMILATVIALLGAAGMAISVYLAVNAQKGDESTGPMLFAAGGGLVLLVGILLLLPAIMRPFMRLLGKVFSPVGRTAARFAGLNAARHPRRTTTTVSALVIGAALMAMMATGASTGERTVNEDLTNRKPVDLVVSAPQMPDDLGTRVDAIQGIEKAALVDSAEVKVSKDHNPMTIFAASPEELDSLTQRDGLSDLVKDGELLTGEQRAKDYGLTDGDTIALPSANGGTESLTVHTEGNLDMSLMSPSTLQKLQVDHTTGLFAKLADPDSPERANRSATQVLGDVNAQLADVDSESILYESYEGAERESYTQIINVLLTSTIVLLAVAVLVALVGVANTLSLSVVERTGENALLRALGTSRGQVQAMLAWEGLFIALAGALVGIVLGVVYGIVGARALIPEFVDFQPIIPWSSLLVVLALAVIAGLLASVVPGRVASKTQPAAALAQRDE